VSRPGFRSSRPQAPPGARSTCGRWPGYCQAASPRLPKDSNASQPADVPVFTRRPRPLPHFRIFESVSRSTPSEARAASSDPPRQTPTAEGRGQRGELERMPAYTFLRSGAGAASCCSRPQSSSCGLWVAGRPMDETFSKKTVSTRRSWSNGVFGAPLCHRTTVAGARAGQAEEVTAWLIGRP